MCWSCIVELNRHDTVATHPNIRPAARCTGTVDHLAAADWQIVYRHRHLPLQYRQPALPAARLFAVTKPRCPRGVVKGKMKIMERMLKFGWHHSLQKVLPNDAGT